MKAVLVDKFGGSENLRIGEWPTPEPGENEILVSIAATALNRADILQREGRYPPPKGASPILGLEYSGRVAKVGAKVSRWEVGDEVCGLLAGGGYAEYVTVHENLAMSVPQGIDLVQAAAIPEVFLTAFQALDWLAGLNAGEKVLIHAGASGVGTAAIQIAREKGAEIFVTASAGKHDICKELGATHTIDYKTESFAKVIADITNGEGVNVIIDFISGPYFDANLASLALEGRMIMLAFLGSPKVESANLGPILRKRLTIIGSTLRARTQKYKVKLTRDLNEFAWAKFADGTLKPVIDSIFNWEEVAKAHDYMEANKNSGKVLLRVH